MSKKRSAACAAIAILAMAVLVFPVESANQHTRIAQIVAAVDANSGFYKKIDVSGDFPLTYFFRGDTPIKCILWLNGERQQEDQILEWYFDGGKPLFLVQTIKLYKMHKHRFGPEVETQWSNRYVLNREGVASFSTAAPPETEARELSLKEIHDDLSWIDENMSIARNRAKVSN